MKIKVKIRNNDDIKYYNQDSHWTSMVVEVLGVIEKTNNSSDSYLEMLETIKAAGIVSFVPQPKSTYILMGDFVYDDKWGWQFKIDGGYEEVEINTINEKRAFLSKILTDRQVNSLFDTFEDPFDFIRDEDINKLTEAKYIGEHTATRIIEKFKSTIDMAPAYNFFKPLGVTPLLINKLCETYKGAERAIKKFKENPYILAEDIKGVGFLRADEIALNYNVKPESPFRIKSGVKHIFKEEAQNNGSTWLTIDDFENKIVELLKIDLEVINNTLEEMCSDKQVLKDNDRIALQYYYDLESKIADKLLLLQSIPPQKYSQNDIEEGIKNAQEEQGFEFTDEQLAGIQSILSNNVSLVVGLAGTGKTSIIKGVYKIFSLGTRINQCAFSGQAAKRINEATGYPSSTIHRLLGFQGEKFTYNSLNQLETDVIILDEVSMVGLELFWSLLQAIPLGAKLIMLGDNGQLPPIGVGNLLNDLMNSGKINLVNLTKIHRQAEKSAIITKSQAIRRKEFLLSNDCEGEKVYGALQDLSIYSKQEKDNLLDEVIDTFMCEYKKDYNLKDVQIIVAQNQRVELAREKINQIIQEKINPKYSHYDKEIHIKYGQVIRIGDKIINRENHYDVETPDGEQTSIYNGSMGIVTEISDNYVVVDFYDEGEIVINSDYYGGLELAYAITCHSSQGSQFKTVIVGFDNSSYILLSNEWLYTAITRAKKMCYLITQTKAFNMAVLHHKTVDRNTFLLELLKKEGK